MNCLLLFLVMFITDIYSFKKNDDYPGTFEGFVVGGVPVPIIMYPHVAQLKLGTQVCGGSIISDRVILTAAHCLYSSNNTLVSAVNVTAYLGSDTLLTGYKYSVCKVLPHENYNGSAKEHYYYYDVALILLKKKIEFGPSVKRIEIADTEEFRNERFTFTLAGFGVVTNFFPSGPNKKLKMTRMFYVNSKKCEESSSYAKMDVPDNMFCMIGEGWTSDCFGDSGSGIVWRKKIVGIVSTGRDVFCGSDMLPSMYTDMVHFREWIMENVRELESVPAKKCDKYKRKKDKKNKRKSEFRMGKNLENRNGLSHFRSLNLILKTD